jgi:hypothetical protein
MLTTIAVLVIILGLMVNLARMVQRDSAVEITRELLLRLDVAMQRFIERNGNALPDVTPLIPGQATPDEATLLRNAIENDQDLVRILRSQGDLADSVFSGLSVSYYDQVNLRDAWGSPIVFMPQMHRDIGQAANGYFFFSAGPDRQFLTREDNIYSYERAGPNN